MDQKNPFNVIGQPQIGTEQKSAKDPVCGMSVNPESAAGHDRHEGQDYFFCSQHCLERFRSDPNRYLAPALTQLAPTLTRPSTEVGPPPSSPNQEYTCPMHPEVLRKQPGHCPKCGMALELADESASDQNRICLPNAS